MNMLPTRDICLLFVVLCSVWTAISFGETLQNSDDKVGQDYGNMIRRKRAGGQYQIIGLTTQSVLPRSCRAGEAAIIGVTVVKRLLRGSKKMTPGDTEFKLYSKHGTYQRALKDFKSLRPKSVKELQGPDGEKILAGIKGDREIILRNAADAKGSSKVTIEIKKMWELNGEKTGRTTQKIVYFN